MSARALIAGLALVAGAATTSAEEQFYYVDAQGGSDVPSGGTLAAPWRTIGYAVTQPLHSLARINLLPGVYSEASGESFPIDLAPNVNIHGAVPGGAFLWVPFSPTLPTQSTVFRSAAPFGGGSNTFADFELCTDHVAIELLVGGLSSPYFSLTNVSIDAPIAVKLTSNDGAIARLTISGSRLTATVNAIVADVPTPTLPSSLDVSIFSSEISSAPGTVAVALTGDGTNTTVRFDTYHSIFHTAATGVLLAPSGGAFFDADVERALFHGLGAGGPADGGLVEVVTGPGPPPTVDLANCVFWQNASTADLPGYSAATYTVTTCMFEDPTLAALPGSVAGPPLLVDPAGGDWHAYPASPTRNAGTVTGSSGYYDHEGDPGTATFGGDGLPDLGPDETYDRYVWFHPPLALNSPSQLRVLGPTSELTAVFVGPLMYFPGFGSGLQLGSLYVDAPLLIGALSPSGLLETSITLNGGTSLAGFPYMIQAGYLDPVSFAVSWSSNARKGWVRY